MEPGGIAHLGQFVVVNIALYGDVHLVAVDRVRVAVEAEDRARELVRCGEMHGVEFEIDFRIVHIRHPRRVRASGAYPARRSSWVSRTTRSCPSVLLLMRYCGVLPSSDRSRTTV